MMARSFVFGCMFCLLVAGWALASPDDPILGKAGGYIVRQSDVVRLISFHPPADQERIRNDPKQLEAMVKRMLEIKIIADLARQKKFDQQAEINRQLSYIADDFLSREYLAKVVMQDITVTEADLKEFYVRNKETLNVPEMVKARHILIKVDPTASDDDKKEAKARAEALLKRLKAGEAFDKLAEAYSEDPSSKTKGGDLGYFRQGQMAPSFEGAAFYTNPGELSNVVETKYGYHIIKVEEHTEARERSFAEVKDFIRERLQKQLIMFKMQQFIETATQSAGAEIYSDKILVDAKQKEVSAQK